MDVFSLQFDRVVAEYKTFAKSFTTVPAAKACRWTVTRRNRDTCGGGD